ncbi:MAG: carbonic anhydrase family protein [Rhodocyclaceae bacterium]
MCRTVRQRLVAAFLIASLPMAAEAAWVAISADTGKRVEIDPASVRKEEGNKQVVLGRILFDKELTDPRTSGAYKSIEALTRYDCGLRTYTTLRRTWRKADGELLREEEVRTAAEMPVRSGSLDDKLLREVCRPRSPGDAQTAAMKMAEKANEAAADLRRANEAMIQKEVQKGLKTAVLPPAAKEPAKEPAKASGKEAAAPAASPVVATKPAPKPVPRPRPVKKPPVDAGQDAVKLHAHIHWDYEGEGRPDNWGKLRPEYGTCASGKRQSPIDIRDGIRVDQPAIDFSWRPSQFRIVDNGHTVQVAVGGSSLTLLGKNYELIQFHFHRPAEERVNGRGFDMVAHFVHKAEDGRLAVVAVLMEQGVENPFVQTLWNYMPLERNEDVAPPNVVVDPAAFLPADRAYYTYMGSLTTPPCTENVQWLVMRQPVQVSAEQIGIFSRLYRNNARPVQPSFGRLIKESR